MKSLVTPSTTMEKGRRESSDLDPTLRSRSPTSEDEDSSRLRSPLSLVRQLPRSAVRLWLPAATVVILLLVSSAPNIRACVETAWMRIRTLDMVTINSLQALTTSGIHAMIRSIVASIPYVAMPSAGVFLITLAASRSFTSALMALLFLLYNVSLFCVILSLLPKEILRTLNLPFDLLRMLGGACFNNLPFTWKSFMEREESFVARYYPLGLIYLVLECCTYLLYRHRVILLNRTPPVRSRGDPLMAMAILEDLVDNSEPLDIFNFIMYSFYCKADNIPDPTSLHLRDVEEFILKNMAVPRRYAQSFAVRVEKKLGWKLSREKNGAKKENTVENGNRTVDLSPRGLTRPRLLTDKEEAKRSWGYGSSPTHPHYRPLLFVLVLWFIHFCVTSVAMPMMGFRQVLPIRKDFRQSMRFYVLHPNRSSSEDICTNRPLMILHGFGIGILPYLPQLICLWLYDHKLKRTEPWLRKPIIVAEFRWLGLLPLGGAIHPRHLRLLYRDLVSRMKQIWTKVKTAVMGGYEITELRYMSEALEVRVESPTVNSRDTKRPHTTAGIGGFEVMMAHDEHNWIMPDTRESNITLEQLAGPIRGPAPLSPTVQPPHELSLESRAHINCTWDLVYFPSMPEVADECYNIGCWVSENSNEFTFNNSTPAFCGWPVWRWPRFVGCLFSCWRRGGSGWMMAPSYRTSQYMTASYDYFWRGRHMGNMKELAPRLSKWMKACQDSGCADLKLPHATSTDDSEPINDGVTSVSWTKSLLEMLDRAHNGPSPRTDRFTADPSQERNFHATAVDQSEARYVHERKFDVFSHSYGTAVASAMMKSYPKVFGRLVLADPICFMIQVTKKAQLCSLRPWDVELFDRVYSEPSIKMRNSPVWSSYCQMFHNNSMDCARCMRRPKKKRSRWMKRFYRFYHWVVDRFLLVIYWYIVYRDFGTRWTTARQLQGHEYLDQGDLLKLNENLLVVVSSNDLICPGPAVYRSLKSKNKLNKIILADGHHGMFLTKPVILQQINNFLFRSIFETSTTESHEMC